MSVLRIAALVCAFGLVTGASATTFNVDNFNDLNDASPVNGACEVGDGSCSLRAAVQEANALAGHDVIVLSAGTYNLTQTYNCGGPTCGLFVEVRPDVEIVGQGVGVTSIQGAAINYQGAVFQLTELSGDSGATRFADLSLNPGTFTGFDGQFANGLMESIFACAACGLELERLEINLHHTSPSGGLSALMFSGAAPATVRDTVVNISGGATNSPSPIYSQAGTPLLIEDVTINGGNSMSTGVNYRASSGLSAGPNTLTIRRSRFLDMSSTGYATILLANINIGAETQALIEDVEITGGGPGVFVRHYGPSALTTYLTIERSLFSGMSAEALRLAGPCVATVRNSTISAAATGVALSAPESSGTGTCDVALDSVTIAGGTTSVAVGSGLGTVSARNSILADASSAACTGTLDSLGHNLIEGACTVAGDTTGNITGVDPMLDALADNGGATRTQALLAGSPAIDVGDVANCPAEDQRTYARPADGDGNMDARCDIGAFEKDALPAPSNTAPVAADDAATVDEDMSLDIPAATILSNDSDGEADPLQISDSSGTTGQGASFACDVTGCSYDPIADFFGSDSFDYEVCDDAVPALCDTATINVTVNPVNDAPDFLPGAAQVFAGGSSGAQSEPGWASSIDLGAGEPGQSVMAFEVALDSDPDAVVTGLPSIDASGNLGFTLSGASGNASFGVVLRDDGGVANGGVDVSVSMPLNIAVGAAADVAVTIEQCSLQAPPGELYAYAMRIDNSGPDAALDIVLDAPLPAGASIDGIGNADCMDAGTSLACHIVRLDAGSSVAVPMTLLMPGVGPATLDLSTTISTATDDVNVANDSAASTVALVPGLILDSGFESCDGLLD